MRLRYDDRTGMFKEVPSVSDRLRGICRIFGRHVCIVFMMCWRGMRVPFVILFYPVMKWWTFFRQSWVEGDRFMTCVMIFLGFVLIGAYRLACEIVLSLFDGLWHPAGTGEALIMALVVGAVVLFAVFYGRALVEARQGSLVVYQNWADFGRSALWVLAFPIGLPWLLDASADWILRGVGLSFLLLGVVSLGEMMAGAFKYNSGAKRWLSLFARVGVILLLVLAFVKLQEKLDRYKRGELGVIRGVLIPLAVFAWMFNSLIRPMIRTERCRLVA